MPTPIAEMQSNFSLAGRIRTGYSVPVTKNGKTFKRPMKSATFILTSHNAKALEKAAEIYGGKVEPWDGGNEPFRLTTAVAELPVLMPPVNVYLGYEMYAQGKCVRRCDGVTESKSGRPCMCPKDTQEWLEQKKRGTACAFTVRCNAWVTGLPTGMGLWRLDTHSYFAGTELPKTVEFLRDAAERNIYIPATIAIETMKSGEKVFPVVRVRMEFSMDQLMTATAQLGSAPLPRLLSTSMVAGAPQLTAPQPALPAPQHQPQDAPDETEYAEGEDETVDAEYRDDDGETRPELTRVAADGDAQVIPHEPAEQVDPVLLVGRPLVQCTKCAFLVAELVHGNGKSRQYNKDGRRHLPLCKQVPTGFDEMPPVKTEEQGALL